MNRRKIYTAAASLALILTVSACSPGVTDATQQAIRYSGGSLDIEQFKECQTGPAREYGDPGDHVYYYPAAQRTFSFTDNANANGNGHHTGRSTYRF